MSKASHTQGEWQLKHISGSNFAVQCFDIRADGVFPIFNKDTSCIDGATICVSPEDARLIAAAPELLEALKEAHRALMFYEWYNNPKSGWASSDNVTVRGMVDAAIAKATGEAA